MAACHCYSWWSWWSDNFWVRLIGLWMASLLCYLQSVIVEFSLQQVQGFMVCNQFIKWTWCLLQFATEFSKEEMVTLKKVITPATIRVPRTQTALQQLESLHKVHLISGSNFLVNMNKICGCPLQFSSIAWDVMYYWLSKFRIPIWNCFASWTYNQSGCRNGL